MICANRQKPRALHGDARTGVFDPWDTRGLSFSEGVTIHLESSLQGLFEDHTEEDSWDTLAQT